MRLREKLRQEIREKEREKEKFGKWKKVMEYPEIEPAKSEE